MLTQLRQQLADFWNKQGRTQRATFIGLLLLGIVLIAAFVAWSGAPTYEVAFSGLSEADAGLIVEKLAEANIPYQIQGSGTILVTSDQVYETRLRMAREGLPEGGTVGYELFSGNTLGMTDFTQRVNYQRALEGELERTIGSLAPVGSVRVHIVTPEKSLLSQDQAPTTASVTIQERPGSYLDSAQVRAITHLVASSVEGLKPEQVVVIDVDGNLLASGSADEENTALAQADSRRAAEVNAALELEKKVQDILDTALGPNRSVVQAYVSLDWTERETTTQAYDPATTAIRSSQVISETYATGDGLVGGIPGAEPNLPDGLEADTTGQTGSNYQHYEETTNYEVTQMQTREMQTPGEIERISLSVLVDNITDTLQLDTLNAVVAAAVGIDPDRGDTLAVETIDFDRTYYETQAAEMDSSQKMDTYLKIGQAIAVVLLLAALLWYVQRLLNKLRLTSAQNWTPILKPVSAVSLPGTQAVPELSAAASLSQALRMQAAEMGAESKPQGNAAPNPVPEPVAPEIPIRQPRRPSVEEERLQQMANELVHESPDKLADIIRTWLNEDR